MRSFFIRFCLPLSILSVQLSLGAAARAADMPMDVRRIAFGSCNKHDQPQPLWDAILQNRPALFIWAGDIVYNDTEDMSVMQANYQEQKRQPGYQRLRESLLPGRVIGIWDDHDYGADDAGYLYSERDASQKQLLDFLDEPGDSVRRGTAGVYTSTTYSHGRHLITVILLDTRYFRQDPGPEADILGEKQWEWLEEVFRQSRSSLHFIVSSIQFVAEDHKYESWGKFPAAKARMYRLIRETGVPGVIFLSGDRHFAELSVQKDPAVVPYPVYDLTASGMTHSWTSLKEEENRFREGKFFTGLNFGLVDIDLGYAAPRLFLQVRDRDNMPRISREVLLKELRPAP